MRHVLDNMRRVMTSSPGSNKQGIRQVNDYSRKKSFAEWFGAQFKALKISEREFARAAGISPTTPRTWLYGVSLPTFETCDAIARVLKVPVETVRAAAGYGRLEGGSEDRA